MSQFKYILVSFIIKKLQQCPGNSVTNILIYLLTYRWWIHIMHTNSSSLLINFNCIEMFPASICVWPHSYKKSNRSNRSQHFLNQTLIFRAKVYLAIRLQAWVAYVRSREGENNNVRRVWIRVKVHWDIIILKSYYYYWSHDFFKKKYLNGFFFNNRKMKLSYNTNT